MDLSNESQTLVIIGNGMVGFKLCQRMVEYGANDEIRIVVFGEEPRPAYDRVHLTELFSGRPSASLALVPDDWYAHNGIELYLDDPIVELDRERSTVRSSSGRIVEYNRLVLATGSRPFVPPIEGSKLPGVFCYRTIDDVYEIEDHAEGSKSAAVIGGGLLGLEAAKAVYDLGLDVHVVETAPWLMPRQLDGAAAAVLRDKIEKLGVKIHCNKKLLRIEACKTAEGRDSGLRRLVYADGQTLEVDMVVFSAGIRPRGDLAKAAGLGMSDAGGIVVDDHLQTTDPQIYAIGECASHRNVCYGLVVPGYQQVDVLAANLVGGEHVFEGADVSAKLKLMGVTVAALGEHDGDKRLGGNALVFDGGGMYRKLVVRNGRLIGAVTVGDWENLDRIRELLKAPLPLSFWDMRRFRGTGNLWPKSESAPVSEWTPEAVVCGCLRVSRGAIGLAIAEGCGSVEELCARTKAGTLCGSCKPLLSELLGLDGPPSVLEAGPVSRFEQAPRSRRDGARSRRDVPRSRRDLAPSSRLDSSRLTQSGIPSSTREDGARSRRDPSPSSLDPTSVLDIAPLSRRVAITIAERPSMPQTGLLGLVGFNVATTPPPASVVDDDDEPAPMSRRGQALRDDDDDEPAPMSIRSAGLASRANADLPPPTVRSSLPPPPSSVLSERAAALPGLIRAAASLTPTSGLAIEPAPPTPRVTDPIPPTPLRRTSAAPVTEAPPTPRAGTVPPATPRSMTSSNDKAPRSERRSDIAVVTPRSLMSLEHQASEGAPRSTRGGAGLSTRTEAKTPPAGIVLSSHSSRDLAPASVGSRSARMPIKVAVLDMDAAPPTPVTGGARLPAPAPLPALVPAVENASAAHAAKSDPPPTSRRSALLLPAASSDPPPTSRRSALLLPAAPLAPSSDRLGARSLSVPPPPAHVSIIEIPAPAVPRFDASLFAVSDEPPASGRAALPPPSDEPTTDEDSSSSSRPRISLLAAIDEADISEILTMPARESLVPGGERSPMSRRSWVPPKRLSLPPGALSMTAPPPPRASIAQPIQPPPERGRKILLVASIVAVCSVLVLAFAPSISPARSIQSGNLVYAVMRKSALRQATGYALVTLTMLSLGISLRKRWKRFALADVPVWRAVHGVVAGSALVLFFLHTGLHAGSKLNLVLTIDFLVATVLGAVAGLASVFSFRWGAVVARDRRLRTSWAHLLVTWPLPILVALHVLAVYYF